MGVAKYRFNRKAFDKTRKRKKVTIPDQSMSIQEIVRRFTRGIPVDVVQRQGVYVDQSEHDLEALARMDFADKADMANSLSDHAEGLKEKIVNNERARRAKKEQSAKEADQQSGGSGIGNLDNTMPVDTKQTMK